MAKKPTRVKNSTFSIRYQNKEEVEIAIKDIGDLHRELLRVSTLQNDEIAKITEKYAPTINELNDKIAPMQQAVQAWCESNRNELTNNGKTKTGSFNTGEVQWRQRPPSIGLSKIAVVLENLHRLGLERFIRVKEEINKDAMLNEAEIAATVAGVTVKKGFEDFVITPFEQDIK